MLPTADGLLDDRLSKHCALLVGDIGANIDGANVSNINPSSYALVVSGTWWIHIAWRLVTRTDTHKTPSCCTSCHLMMGTYASAIYIYFWEKQNSISACGRLASMFIWFGKNILLVLLVFCLCCCWITKVVGWFCY